MKYRASALSASDYGKRTFFEGVSTLQAGAQLKQPDLAAFLRAVAHHGANYMYTGAWAQQAVAIIAALGGKLTLADLDGYRAQWRTPWTMTYRDVTLHVASGRTFGGLWQLSALKALENVVLPTAPHYANHANSLEILVRLAREVSAQAWLLDATTLDDPQKVADKLSSAYGKTLWQAVQQKLSSDARALVGSHSYAPQRKLEESDRDVRRTTQAQRESPVVADMNVGGYAS